MSIWCHEDSRATGDCQLPPLAQVTLMCLQFAAPPLLHALRNRCWQQEGCTSTPASPQVLRASPQALLHHWTVVTSAQLLAGTGA